MIHKSSNKLTRKLLVAFGVALGATAFGAHASVINYGLQVPGGNYSWTDSQGVTFYGYQNVPSVPDPIEPTYLNYKSTPGQPWETGMGLLPIPGTCTFKCSQYEISATPNQALDFSIPTGSWNTLTVGIGSLDSEGNLTYTTGETALIWGMSSTEVVGSSTPTPATLLFDYTYTGGPHSTSMTFTHSELLGFNYLELTNAYGFFGNGGSGNASNILLIGLSTATGVPEPSTVGIFGLGLIMIGAAAGIRRRVRGRQS